MIRCATVDDIDTLGRLDRHITEAELQPYEECANNYSPVLYFSKRLRG